MFDPETFERCRITLDWDKISRKELFKRLSYIGHHFYFDLDPEKTIVRRSAYKGYHVILWFRHPRNVALIRDLLKDDGVRLVKDILRSHKAHDVLWKEKHIGINIIRTEDLYTLRSEVS